jgi:hypothetical protein
MMRWSTLWLAACVLVLSMCLTSERMPSVSKSSGAPIAANAIDIGVIVRRAHFAFRDDEVPGVWTGGDRSYEAPDNGFDAGAIGSACTRVARVNASSKRAEGRVLATGSETDSEEAATGTAGAFGDAGAITGTRAPSIVPELPMFGTEDVANTVVAVAEAASSIAIAGTATATVKFKKKKHGEDARRGAVSRAACIARPTLRSACVHLTRARYSRFGSTVTPSTAFGKGTT